MSRVNLGMGGSKKKSSPKKKAIKSKGSAQGVKMKSKGGAMGGKKEMMPGGMKNGGADIRANMCARSCAKIYVNI